MNIAHRADTKEVICLFDEFNRELCLHEYEVIEKQIETYHENEVTSIGEIQYSTITGYIVVYCRKCLDIQVKELEE